MILRKQRRVFSLAVAEGGCTNYVTLFIERRERDKQTLVKYYV
jgi:hypothetical protein